MNEHVISPITWYLINVVPVFLETLFILSIIAFSIISIIHIFKSVSHHEYDEEEKYKIEMKKAIRTALLIIIPAVLLSLSPDRNLLIQMYVLDKVTYEKIEEAVALGKDIKEELKSDLIEIVEALK